MNKKAVLSVAERILQLKTLPVEKLPPTLRAPLPLPNIQSVRLHYRAMCKDVGPSLQFVRMFAPAMRWYNPGLVVEKKLDPNGPIAMTIEIQLKDAKEPYVLMPNEYKKPEEIMDRIRAIDAGDK